MSHNDLSYLASETERVALLMHTENATGVARHDLRVRIPVLYLNLQVAVQKHRVNCTGAFKHRYSERVALPGGVTQTQIVTCHALAWAQLLY